MLRAKNLHIGYDTVLAVANDLHIEQGTCMAIVGRNGKGKSTLMQTLRGKLKALHGTIELQELDITHWSPAQLAKEVAWVNTRFLGVPYLSALDYVLLGRIPFVGATGFVSQADKIIAENALEAVGASYLSNRQTLSLSDGERQLLSIARALAQETKIILLDEPTAFLDFFHRRKLMGLLQEIAKEKNRAILLSTHDLHLVSEFQLPIIVINNQGNILQQEAIKSFEALEILLS